MKTTAAHKSLTLDQGAECFIATFLVTFTLNSDDSLSEFPGYDYLQAKADRAIEQSLKPWLGDASLPEPDCPDQDDYWLQGPPVPDSWGAIVWKATRGYARAELARLPSLLAAWEQTVQAQEAQKHPQGIHCPECNGTNVRLVEADGGYECLHCDRPGHESWFGVWVPTVPDDPDNPFILGLDGWSEETIPPDLPLELAKGTPAEAAVRARLDRILQC